MILLFPFNPKQNSDFDILKFYNCIMVSSIFSSLLFGVHHNNKLWKTPQKKNYWRIIMHRNMSMRIHAIDFLHDWSSVWTVCKMQYWRRFSTSNDQVWIDIIV